MYYLQERPTMDRGHSFLSDSGIVVLGAVALVLCKAVAGILLIVFHHHVVTGYFREDRCRSNGI